MNEMPILRRGAGSMRVTSAVPSPTAAGVTARRFTFAFNDALRRDTQEKRRRAVADFLEEWAGAQIVAERVDRHTMRCHVVMTTARAVPVQTAEQFIAECPHVVKGSLEPLPD